TLSYQIDLNCPMGADVRHKVPKQKLRRIWIETQVINRVAREFKIHWKTALHLLEDEKLIVGYKGQSGKLSKPSRPP
ncbi:hypothetical protein, partial [Ruegeria atlantica]|uniref:hypothetical protein n=1 Tax=Ruegeria atlantica TaxID=81569 RepID=UPI001C2C1822